MKKTTKTNKKRFPTFLFGGEKEYFAENLSMLLTAGISVSAAIKIIIDGSAEGGYKKVLTQVLTDLDEGNPLWRSLEGRGILNPSYLYLAKVGEASGRLSENLKIIAEQQKKNKSFRSKLNSALIYPGIILSLTVVVSVGVIWFVIPKMAKIFRDMRIALPLPTKIMIYLGDLITTQPVLFLGSVCLFIAFIIVIFFVPGTKRLGQAILFRLPRIKDLYREVEVARFGYVMFSLAEAGIPLPEAISSIEQSSSIPAYRKFYAYMGKSVNEGNSLEKSFLKYKGLKRLIPVQIQQMIIAGERSGNLTKVLGSISEIYEEKIENTSKNLSVILEPMLLLVVAIGVLFLALAVIMPIYGLVGGMNVQ